MMLAATSFAELRTTVLQIIDETDAKSKNKASSTIETARQLLIAFENAKNIYRDHAPTTPTAKEKVEEFNQMIACLKKVDYCRLNLDAQIQHSINSGTVKGWIPKLSTVYPSHIVPSTSFCVQFFGKFKYADRTQFGEKYKPSLKLCGQTFEAANATHHSIRFNIKFTDKVPNFEKEKCAQFEGRLIVPYENGYVLGSIKNFEFDVLIRALPTKAGTVKITHKEKGAHDNQLRTLEVEWGRSYPLRYDESEFVALEFTSFDGQKTTMDKAGEIPYLKLIRAINSSDELWWTITIIAPTGL